jgi:hypothetical protein
MMRRDKEERQMHAMARQLEGYWHERGFLVTAWVEQLSIKASRGHSATPHWVVRSDMINGHPTRRIPE